MANFETVEVTTDILIVGYIQNQDPPPYLFSAFKLALSNGEDFESLTIFNPTTNILVWSPNDKYYLRDVDGDGFDEAYLKSNTSTYLFSFASASSNQKVASITNGLNKK